MTSFDAFLGKISNEINDLSDLHGTVWDEDPVITTCRRCNVEFSILCRKHHCRECGGIYCDGCAPPRYITIEEIHEKFTSDGSTELKKWYPGKYLGRRPDSMSSNASTTSSVDRGADDGKWYPGKYLGRKKPGDSNSNPPTPTLTRQSSRGSDDGDQLVCIGCRFGETPGIQAKGILKNLYKEYRLKNPEARILPPAPSFILSYGSLYGEGDKSERCLRRVDGQPAHTAGYFELLNKSEYATAIRVSQGGSESLREHCRPSYITVLPQQSVYTTFDPSIRILEIAVLHRNPYLLNPNTPPNSLVFNTRASEVTKEIISPQCAVENFREVCIYSIVCEGKNVILKYQGAGVIELRKLTTTKLSKKGPLSMFSSMLSSSSSGTTSTPNPSPSNSTTMTSSSSSKSPTNSQNNNMAWDGKESILDFSTNATEISCDLASNLF